MGAVLHTPAAMNADERLSCMIKIDGVNRAGLCAFTAADAELLSDKHPSSLSLQIGAGRAGQGARGGIARKTVSRFKTCRKSA